MIKDTDEVTHAVWEDQGEFALKYAHPSDTAPADASLYDFDKRGDWYDYHTMIGTFADIAIDIEFGSYQGDRTLLLQDDDRYGFLVFGYGSCSGCDALQDCHTVQDWIVLRDRLQGDVKWFDSSLELMAGLLKYDWRGTYVDAQSVMFFLGKVAEFFKDEWYSTPRLLGDTP